MTLHGPADPELAIEATALGKSYGALRVLDSVDLRVARGSVLALLGPNGAGKTTTVRVLSTLTRPEAGRARVAGFDLATQPRDVRRAISLTGQHAAVDELQTGLENLRMMGRLRGLSRPTARARAMDLLERFELLDAAQRRVATYSGGMRRRLDLAAGLVCQPTILFLDEPTTGLDPRSRQALWDVVRDLVATGVTVLLTTQYLEEADALADQIAVIDGGRIVAEGSPTELKSRVADYRLELTFADADAFAVAERSLRPRVRHLDQAQRKLTVPTDGSAAHVRALLDDLDPDRRAVTSFDVRGATLDDVFLALTGRTTDPATEAAEPAHV